jgi:uncharacterized paraquat-inducible protein A
MMVCPACDSRRIVLIVSPERRAFCPRCGSRWNQKKGWSAVESPSPSSRVHPSTGAVEGEPHPAA